MLLNKKCVYLGVSLFSAMILGSLNNQNVKAATTSQSPSTQVNDSSVKSTRGQTITSTATITTEPTTTTQSSTSSTASTTGTTTGTGTITPSTSTTGSTGTVLSPSTGTTTSGTTAPSTSTTTGTTTPNTGTTTTTGTTAPSTSTTTTGTTAPSTGTTTTTGTTTSGTGTVTTTGTTTSSTGTTTSSTTTAPTTTSTNTSTTSPTTVTNPYAIPSDVTDNTVVNIEDPLLNYMIKQELKLSATQNITVGDIKNYSGVMNLDDAYYLTYKPSTIGYQVETFSGMQYLKFLPSTSPISLYVNVAYDKDSNPDLTPLEGLSFANQKIGLIGNFSDPNYKEIDVSQLPKLNYYGAGALTLEGSGSISNNNVNNAGINQTQLEELAPMLIKFGSYTSSSLPYGPSIYLNNTNITDFSSLKGIADNSGGYLSIENNLYDPTTLYAVTKQPMTFATEHVTGLNGEDLASTYTVTPAVSFSDYQNNNITYLGNDDYSLSQPDSVDNQFTYENVMSGFGIGNPYTEKIGNTTVSYQGSVTQPIDWQSAPSVKILYTDQNNQPILSNGSQLTETVDGTTIGSTYDLTPYTKLTGYTFVNSSGSLTGKYTQNPQVETFEFKAIPVTPPATTPSTGTTTTGTTTTGTTTPSTGTTTTGTTTPGTGTTTGTVPSDTYNDEGTTTTPSTPTTPNITTKPVDITVSAVSKNPVQVYGSDGSAISGKTVILADTTIKQSATINGTLYYQIGNDEWVPASDFNSYQASTGIAKTGTTDAVLVNSEGVTLDYKLAPNTAWKYDRIVTIQGKQYYEVGNNEYLSADDSLAYTPVKADLTIKTPVEVYNSEGKEITRILPTHSDWATDGISTINGIRMYHVGTNEWISAENVNPYTSVKTIFNSTTDTPVFDITGQLTKKTLDPGTAWKVDRITEINGTKYYRVAQNEFVKVPDTSITVANDVIDVSNIVPIYDEKGNVTDMNLAADTAWRFDKTVTIGGQKYYRVATDEYVKA
ncbi:SLAP domain-containing protein [Companilactobacillus sp. HBUAS59544]|uniref:SLAP domain-containing protein n=1 Tax=Companilactobacillus sp. HBUAS59544 TaxID=3109363 RepID=UPI002FF4371B